LSSLNSVAHLKLENEQITQLMDYNKGFVDEVYEILESDKEDKYKKKSMKILAEKRENDLKNPAGQQIASCIEMADYTIVNDGSLEDLIEKTEEFISEIR